MREASAFRGEKRRGFLFFCYAQPARQTAHGLIQGYIGPDHKVIDMKAFYSALVRALRDSGRQRR